MLDFLLGLFTQPIQPQPRPIPAVEARVEYPPRQAPTLKDAVFALADEYGVDRTLVNNILECESRWDPTIKDSPQGDRGLWQISRRWHAEVNDEVAYNPLESTRWALQRIKDGYGHEWVCANCALYIRAYYYPDMPKMDDLKPNSVPQVGALAIFQYKTLKHIAYVKELKEDGFTVSEANYTPGRIADRFVLWSDANLIGFWVATISKTPQSPVQ